MGLSSWNIRKAEDAWNEEYGGKSGQIERGLLQKVKSRVEMEMEDVKLNMFVHYLWIFFNPTIKW